MIRKNPRDLWDLTGLVHISIVETAKENGVNPLAYLQYVFEQLPNVNLEDPLVIDRYLPWSESLPKELTHPQRREK